MPVTPIASTNSSSSKVVRSGPQLINLQQIFTWLLADGLANKEDVKARFNATQGILQNAALTMHPLTALALSKLHSAITPHRSMTIDMLTEWMAQKVQRPFLRIDPLKIDFTKVVDVMSASYAARFHILPIELTPTELIVATAEPFSIEWEAEIAKITRRSIKLVIASPLDIAQYTAQFLHSQNRSRARISSTARISRDAIISNNWLNLASVIARSMPMISTS